jgi:hypothetical protein
MKKTLVALAIVAIAGVSQADLFVSLSAGFGISGPAANGGIVENTSGVDANTVVMQLINGGGNGLDFGADMAWDSGTTFTMEGNDTLIGSLSAVTSGGGDYADWGSTINGNIGGNGTAWAADTWIVVSGIEDGGWTYTQAITLADADYSDPKTLSEIAFFDNAGAGGAASNSMLVSVPEPATIGLFGIGGLGAWLLRRKAKKA